MGVKKVIFIAIVMFLVMCATPVYAQVPLPNAFWGSVEINGSDAPAGTHVKATGDGVEVPLDFNPIITEEDGQYGGPAWNDPKLLVQGEIDPGTVIKFYVSRDGETWVLAETEPATVYWDSGEITRVDLTADIAAPPVGGGGGAPRYYIDTNLFGIEGRCRISLSGKMLEVIEATSEDDMLTITVPDDTIALDKDGYRLRTLEVSVDEDPPQPPEDAHIIGLTFLKVQPKKI